MSQKKLKIFCIHTGVHKGSKAVAQLRLLEPVYELYKRGLIERPMIMDEQTKPVERAFLAEADILYFQGYLTGLFIKLLLEARSNNPKLKLVLDLDDNNLELDPTNPVYMQFCTEEYITIAGQQIKNPALSNNLATAGVLEAMTREADAVTVTQKVLASTLVDQQENIFIKPNFLKAEDWVQEHVPVRQDGFIKIGWQGGNTHIHDWLEYNDALLDVVRKHTNTALEMITTPGQYEQFMKQYPNGRVRFYNFIDYDAHPFRMNCLKPDIGFIPLKETLFNACKSDLKFTEYALLGVPCVVSNMEPYKSSVIHGTTGFLAKNQEEFRKYLNMLIKDPDLRAEIGNNARAWAIENRTYTDKNLSYLYDIFYNITRLNAWHQPKE